MAVAIGDTHAETITANVGCAPCSKHMISIARLPKLQHSNHNQASVTQTVGARDINVATCLTDVLHD